MHKFDQSTMLNVSFIRTTFVRIEAQIVKIFRQFYESRMAQLPKLSVVVGQKSMLPYYYIQNVKDGIQIRAYKIRKVSVAHFSQFISVKVRKILRKTQA